MAQILAILRLAAVLVAAIVLGNWFLSEVRKSKIKGDVWYKPYISLPGILIMIIIFTPVIIWIVSKF